MVSISGVVDVNSYGESPIHLFSLSLFVRFIPNFVLIQDSAMFPVFTIYLNKSKDIWTMTYCIIICSCIEWDSPKFVIMMRGLIIH